MGNTHAQPVRHEWKGIFQLQYTITFIYTCIYNIYRYITYTIYLIYTLYIYSSIIQLRYIHTYILIYTHVIYIYIYTYIYIVETESRETQFNQYQEGVAFYTVSSCFFSLFLGEMCFLVWLDFNPSSPSYPILVWDSNGLPDGSCPMCIPKHIKHA